MNNRQSPQPQQPTINKSLIDRVKGMAQMVNNSRDPQAVMNMIAQQNPQMAQFMQTVSGSGMSPRAMFYQMAKQRGIDPDAVIAAFK